MRKKDTMLLGIINWFMFWNEEIKIYLNIEKTLVLSINNIKSMLSYILFSVGEGQVSYENTQDLLDPVAKESGVSQDDGQTIIKFNHTCEI